MKNDMRVSVVVVTYENPEEVRECLLALQQQTLDHELIVIDNSISNEVARLVSREFASARLYRGRSVRAPCQDSRRECFGHEHRQDRDCCRLHSHH